MQGRTPELPPVLEPLTSRRVAPMMMAHPRYNHSLNDRQQRAFGRRPAAPICGPIAPRNHILPRQPPSTNLLSRAHRGSETTALTLAGPGGLLVSYRLPPRPSGCSTMTRTARVAAVCCGRAPALEGVAAACGRRGGQLGGYGGAAAFGGGWRRRRLRLVAVRWRPGEEGVGAVSGGETDSEVLLGAGGGLRPAEILSVAESYVDAWWRGMARDPDAAADVIRELVAAAPAGLPGSGGSAGGGHSAGSGSGGGLSEGDGGVLELMPDGVLHKRPLRGYDALISQLAAQHAEYHRVQYRPVTSAVSPTSSCAYLLGEYRMQDVGGLAGHPATFRVSRGYCLFKLRVDPCSGRINRGWVRRQMTQEERDERVWDPVHVYPAGFPLEHLHLTRGGRPDPRVMEEAACAWVAAQAKHPPPPPVPGAAAAATYAGAAVPGPSHDADGSAAAVPSGAVTTSAAEGGKGDVSGGGAAAGRADVEGAAATSAGGGGGGDVASWPEEVVEAPPAAEPLLQPPQFPTAEAAEDAEAVAAARTRLEQVPPPPSPSPLPSPVLESGLPPTVATKAAVAAAAEAAAAAAAKEEEREGEDTPAAAAGTSGEATSGGSGGGGGALLDSVDTSGLIHSISPEVASTSPSEVVSSTSPRIDSQGGGAGQLSNVAAGGGDVTEEGAEAAAAPPPPTRTQARLADHILAADCRLLDAYGLWPAPEYDDGSYAPTYGGTYGGQRPQAVVGARRVLHRIQAQHKRCARVEPLLYDVAVSDDHNVAFVHWVNHITPAPEPAPRPPRPPPPKSHPHPHTRQPAKTAVAREGPAVLEGPTVGRADERTKMPSAAVAASTAASAAATAANAAAQAATVAADVATTAASAASVAASTANTAATIAATAATAAAFAAGDVEERPAGLLSRGLPSPAMPDQPAASEPTAAVQTPGQNLDASDRHPQQPLGQAKEGRQGDVASASMEHVGVKPEASSEGTGGPASALRPMGLQDLRISMPPMPPMPQIQSQIQNLEEVLSAAAQRVAGAAGTAAAAASAAAAAATAVIMAESGGSGSGSGSGSGGSTAAAAGTGVSGDQVAAARSTTAAAAAAAAVAAATRPARSTAPAAPPPPVPYQQDCMAVLLFHDEGTVSDVWVFRGPYHYEKHLLRP